MHMIDLQLDPERLVAHAQAGDHNRAHDEDLGYAAHAWLGAAFGELGPSCFRLSERRDGILRLLAYAQADAATLERHAESFAEPLALSVCDWRMAASKYLGDIALSEGAMLGFEVRACPVKRSDSGERDAYLHAVEASPDGESPPRSAVYAGWLQERLAGAATLDNDRTELASFRLVSAWRRRHDRQGRASTGQRLVRPDAVMRGRLTVDCPATFRDLLGRGVGRHRAFGFGMLLLRPV